MQFQLDTSCLIVGSLNYVDDHNKLLLILVPYQFPALYALLVMCNIYIGIWSRSCPLDNIRHLNSVHISSCEGKLQWCTSR
jgi:hypothetical protein